MCRAKSAVGVLTFAMLLMWGPPSLAQEAQQEAEQLLKRAQQQYRSGQWKKARSNFKKAYAAAEDQSELKVLAALDWSSLLWEQGDYARAEKRADEALELAKERQMHGALGRLLLTRGHIEASRGRLQDGEDTLKLCVELAQGPDDQVFAALCKLNHRLVRQMRGRPAGPDSDYKEAVAAIEAAGTSLSVGTSMAKTAELYDKAGDSERALQLLMRAQQKFEAGDNVPAQRRNRLRIARHLQERGRFDEAKKYLEGLEAKFDAMDSRPSLIDALTLTARDARHRGDLATASKRLMRALDVARETGSPSLIGRSELTLCEFGVETGKLAEPASYCAAAATSFDKLDIPHLAARSNAQLAGLHHRAGKLNKASSHYSKAIQRLEKTPVNGADERSALGNYRANLCQVEMSLRSNGAHHLCRKALAELESLDQADPTMLASTHYAIGVTAGRAWREEKGVEHLQKAAELAEALSPPKTALAADAHLRRGVLLADKAEDADAARRAFRRGLSLTDEATSPRLASARVQLRTQLAQLELGRKDWKAARSLLEQLVDDDHADIQARAWAYSALARARLESGDRDGAREALEAGLPLAKQAGNDDLVTNIEANLEKFE